jgi:hypothetical protein
MISGMRHDSTEIRGLAARAISFDYLDRIIIRRSSVISRSAFQRRIRERMDDRRKRSAGRFTLRNVESIHPGLLSAFF